MELCMDVTKQKWPLSPPSYDQVIVHLANDIEDLPPLIDFSFRVTGHEVRSTHRVDYFVEVIMKRSAAYYIEQHAWMNSETTQTEPDLINDFFNSPAETVMGPEQTTIIYEKRHGKWVRVFDAAEATGEPA